MKGFTAVLVLLTSVSAGCASVPSISDTRAVAHDTEVEQLRASYVNAAESLGLTLQQETENELIVASPAENAVHRIHFGTGDTLLTMVRISSQYSPFMPEDHMALGRLLEDVRRDLGDAGSFVEPAAAYPQGVRTCEGPRHIGVENRTAPVLHGGMMSVMMSLRYPQEARRGNVHGRVMVDVLVNEEGRVECAVAREGLPGGLSEEAVRAVTQATFDPATIDGEPVRMMLSLPIEFRQLSR